jgi:hypothetical protein
MLVYQRVILSTNDQFFPDTNPGLVEPNVTLVVAAEYD